ncbi:hypothetical protein EDB83DRAFT_2518217 [Lactarius deliciosus]|nr:hypothetical protein EDB83DRAFT_2518217 [Lactarius deliciosus]
MSTYEGPNWASSGQPPRAKIGQNPYPTLFGIIGGPAGPVLSDSPNTTVRDTGDVYARQYSNLRSTSVLLHSLLDTTVRVAHSVTLHSTTAVNNSKTVSLLREQSTGQHLLHLSRTQVAKTVSAAQERRRSDTRYDGPSDYSSTLARISAWRSAVGTQAFPEAAAGTLVLGGKVLVLDVALIPEPTVHASYAGSAEGRNSPAMDAFFSRLQRVS